MSVERFSYGADLAQNFELFRPAGPSRGVAVVIHGGFWKVQYDATYGLPLAQDLARRGWAAINLEYRRVGNGGGVPETLDDIAAGIDRLAAISDLDVSRAVAIGHSAGGQLAAWAAARGRFERWRPERVRITQVISQAGVLDLTAAAEASLGTEAVRNFVGGPPGDPAYDLAYGWADPMRHLPLDVPVWCVHGTDDDIVPISQSEQYVARSRIAGGEAELVRFPGDHFDVIHTDTVAWRAVLRVLDQISPPRGPGSVREL